MINMYENEIGSIPEPDNNYDKRSDSKLEKVASLFGLGDTDEVIQKLVERTKENPVPVALIGTGLAWLLWPKPSPEMKARARNVQAATRERVYSTKESVVGAGESIAESVSEFGNEVADTTSHISHLAASKMNSVSHSAKETCSKTKNQVEEVVDAQPVVAALGALVAGLIAGAIPKASRAENRLVGDYSDRIKEGIRSEAKDAVVRGKAVVNETVAHAVEELDENGLTFQGIKDKVTHVASNIKNEAVTKAKSEIDKTSESVANEASTVKEEIKKDIVSD